MQLGLGGSRFVPDDLWYGNDTGVTILTMDDAEDIGRDATIGKICQTIGDGPIYITIDTDGVEPSSCTATAAPGIGGTSPRDVQRSLQGLMSFDVIDPRYYATGITPATAANLMFELTGVIAASLIQD